MSNVNDIPGGSVGISGTSSEGEVLTASNTLTDSDGLGSISYQWLRGGSDIGGATGSTYTLVQLDVGSAISIKGFYTDALGTAEVVTSSATSAVSNVEDEATGTLSVTGTASEGGSLGVSFSPSDVDGSVSTVYQWQLSSDGSSWSTMDGETNASYSIASDQSAVGKYLRVTAVTTDALGGTTNFTSSATSAVSNVNDVPNILSSFSSLAVTDALYSYTILAVDDDPGDTISFSAVSIPSWLTFDPSSGELAGTPVRENLGVSSINLRVTDSAGLSVEQLFQIEVTASNNAPKFTSGSLESVSENLEQSTVIYKATATDSNSFDKLTYSISGIDSDFLTIDADDGEVRLKSVADYEIKSLYSFVVAVTDNGKGLLTDTKTISFTITDINEKPTFSSSADGSIVENSTTEVVIYKSEASDPDNGDKLTYSISGTDSDFLTIDADDGEVRLKSVADYESKPFYSFAVTVTDDGTSPLLALKEITINVSDVLDSVLENSSVENVIYRALNTSGISDVNFEVFGIDKSEVGIDSLGNINLIVESDFEVKNYYTFEIKITNPETGKIISNELAKVDVINDNDNKPKFSETTFNYNLPLSLAVGTQIGNFVAFDKDGDQLAYSIVSGNKNEVLSIDASTGLLTTAKSFESEALLNFWGSDVAVTEMNEFSVVPIRPDHTSSINLVVAASDGKHDDTVLVALNLPEYKNEGSISSDGLGNIKFGDIANGLKYNIYKSLAQEQVKNDINLSDLQAMADHVSGKNTLSLIATTSADMDESGEVNLLDGVQLARYLDNGSGSKLIVVDSSGSDEVEIWPGASLNLNGVLLGDLDGSYPSTL